MSRLIQPYPVAPPSLLPPPPLDLGPLQAELAGAKKNRLRAFGMPIPVALIVAFIGPLILAAVVILAFHAKEVQTITLSGWTGHRSFTLTFRSKTTGPIIRGRNGSARDVQEALTSVGAVNEGVTGRTDRGPFRVTFASPEDTVVVNSSDGVTGSVVSRGAGDVILVAAIVLCLVLIVLAVTLVVRHWRRPKRIERRILSAQKEHEQASLAATAAWREARAAWEAAKRAHDASEVARVGRLPEYWPATLLSRPRRVDAFGDAVSWPHLLFTYGGSVLGSGGDLLVLDFSETESPAPLVALCSVLQVPSLIITLPEDIASCDLLTGLAPAEICDVLVESLYSDMDGATRDQRALATRALGEAMDVLAPNITTARLWRAVRAVMGTDPPPDGTGELSLSEWERLSRVFSEDYRVRMGERLFSLELQLHGLRQFGTAVATGGPTRPRFECYAISRRGATLQNELLRDFLLQRAIRHLRQGGGERGLTIIVAGADYLTERHIRRLDEQTQGRSVHLVLLFRDLREQSLDLAGSGGAIAFLRLSNATQAERAADWIGREYRFVLGQISESRGTSESTTFGQSTTFTETVGESRTVTDPAALLHQVSMTESYSRSQAESEQRSRTTGTSREESATQQRVYEHAVDPTTLRSLPDNCLLLVEFHRPSGGRRVLAADCTPELALDPRVSPTPLPPDLTWLRAPVR